MIITEEWQRKDELIILRRDRKILTRPIKALTNGKKAWRRWMRGVIDIVILEDEPCADCIPAWKRKQLGTLSMMGAASGSNRIAGDGSNIVISKTRAGATCTAGARFQQAGNISEIGPIAELNDFDSQEWWNNRPALGGTPGVDYDIRTVSMTAGLWDNFGAGTGTWIQISSGRTWSVVRTCCLKDDEGVGTDNANSPMQLRNNGQTVALGSFNLECSATAT